LIVQIFVIKIRVFVRVANNLIIYKKMESA